MKLIETLTNEAKQNHKFILSDGSVVDFSMRYVDNQKGWFYSFTYGTFTVYNRRVVVSKNMIRAFRNVLPFGLSCNTIDGYEPVLLNDFANGRASLFLLSNDEIYEAETAILESIDV